METLVAKRTTILGWLRKKESIMAYRKSVKRKQIGNMELCDRRERLGGVGENPSATKRASVFLALSSRILLP